MWVPKTCKSPTVPGVDFKCFVRLLDGLVVLALAVIGVPEHGESGSSSTDLGHSATASLGSAHFVVEPTEHLTGVGRTGVKCQTFTNLYFVPCDVPEKQHIRRCQRTVSLGILRIKLQGSSCRGIEPQECSSPNEGSLHGRFLHRRLRVTLQAFQISSQLRRRLAANVAVFFLGLVDDLF